MGSFPNNYRPRTLEERIRRSHQKQLEAQIDALNRSRRTDGPRNLHEKVAQREEAYRAAAATTTAAAAAASASADATVAATTAATEGTTSTEGSAAVDGTDTTIDATAVDATAPAEANDGSERGGASQVRVSHSSSNLPIDSTPPTSITVSATGTSDAHNNTDKKSENDIIGENSSNRNSAGDDTCKVVKDAASTASFSEHQGLEIPPIPPQPELEENAINVHSSTETSTIAMHSESTDIKNTSQLASVDDTNNSNTHKSELQIDNVHDGNSVEAEDNSEPGGSRSYRLKYLQPQESGLSTIPNSPVKGRTNTGNNSNNSGGGGSNTPLTPLGGRKGAEIARAKENDVMYEAQLLEAQDSETTRTSPNSRSHSFGGGVLGVQGGNIEENYDE